MAQRISVAESFSVDRGSEEQLKETLRIFHENGIRWCNGDKANEWDNLVPSGSTINYYLLENRIYVSQDGMEQEIHHTPEEFYSKYGRGFCYPFGVVGSMIERKGRYYKELDPSKTMILDRPYKCFIGVAGHPFFVRDLLAIISNSDNPFVTERSSSSKAWVEVDPPEPKTLARPMNADEVAALGPIWVNNGQGVGIFFGATLQLDVNGDISFGGRLISHCLYAKSAIATAWLPFTVAEVVR